MIQWHQDEYELIGHGAWHDDGTPLPYRVDYHEAGQWRARFEGQVIAHGTLQEVLAACETWEPTKADIDAEIAEQTQSTG